MKWLLSWGGDPRALAVVDGTGAFAEHGPHYSRRSPGSKTFTGVGREIVLVTACGRAVWAVVYQRTPTAQKGGKVVRRGLGKPTDTRPRYVWRNMMFRNLGAGLSSALIELATERTYAEWLARYGEIPAEPLRTEIDVARVRSGLPGYCYLRAGWKMGPTTKRGKRFLFAPAYEGTAAPPAVQPSIFDEAGI